MPLLVTKEYCTGCTACASTCPKDCITMTADANGFLCPVVDTQKCVSCGLCEKSCPIIYPLKIANNEPEAYAAYSNDEEMRKQSSSGGVFTEIAKTVLKDSGAVFGAAYNERFDVVHICVETEDELIKLRGAKYAQSDLRGVFLQIKQKLDGGQKVLFSGTPCQVGGLKSFLHKDYENLLTIDFICHSVPSPMAWREYVQYRAEQDNGGKLPISINLRSKTTGWSKYQYSNYFEYPDGHTHTAISSQSLYMKLFVGGFISRESCGNCRFKGYSRISDITLGDFWGIWDIAPDMDDNNGTSVILVQSERGEILFRQIVDRLMIRPVSLEDARKQNGALFTSQKPNEKASEALDMIRNGRIAESQVLFLQPQIPSNKKAWILVQKILRKIRHIVLSSRS